MQEIARIVHVTDMHLHVDQNGNARGAGTRSGIVKAALGVARLKGGKGSVAKIAAGLQPHAVAALEALITTLQDIAGQAPPDLLVLQTGDVEAYGGTPSGGPAPYTFPAFDYWNHECSQLAGAHVFNLFGNHDAWPGTFPLVAPLAGKAVIGSLSKHPSTTYSASDVAVVTLQSGFRVEIYRVNTVDPGIWASAVSKGRICDPIGSQDPFKKILADAGAQLTAHGKGPVIRILMMHHPPHFFAATGTVWDLIEGRLTNGDDLKPVCQAHRFHLVVAGHRHKDDPSVGMTIRPVTGASPQTPLLAGTMQLVTGSATQDPGTSGPRPSFATYSLLHDSTKQTIDVERTKYVYRSDLDQMFTPEPPEQICQDLPVV